MPLRFYFVQKRSPPYAGDCLSHLCYPTRHFVFTVPGWSYHPARVTVCERLLRMTESTFPQYPRLVLSKGRE
ncbi:23S rRNA (cytosine(1962)-C(5))-methyltransferase RlmI, partial [Salmonella enterica subsp. enterica]|nr:23S rRNA (cytosine(1962)-C(5))-methyltransferase RlmI [Salmonella enterica subsp. enterica]